MNSLEPMNSRGATPPPASSGPTGGLSLRRLAPIAALIAAAALVYAMGWHRYLSLQAVSDHREALQGFVADHYGLALIAFSALYAAVVALSLPAASLLTILAGFLFGCLIGGLAVIAAATLGATLVFLLAKTSLGEPLAAKAGPWLERLRDGFREDAMSYLLFLRLVPLFPFWLVNLAPAFLGVSLGTYVIGTLIGIAPGTFAFAFLGAGLDSIIVEQRAAFEACRATASEPASCEFALDAGALVTGEMIAAFVALGLVALIPVAIKKLKSRK